MAGVYLKLVYVEHKNHHYKKEVKIAEKAKKIDIEFSKDNQMFAISYEVNGKTFIKVLSCAVDAEGKGLEEMFENYKQSKFLNTFEDESTFISSLVFDINKKKCRYIIGYGETKVLVMNLDKEITDNKETLKI